METTAVVNIEINGKSVRNEMESLRAEALRLSAAFVESENALDFSKSKECLTKLLKLLNVIDSLDIDISSIDEMLLSSSESSLNLLQSFKSRFLNIFRKDDLDASAKSIVDDFIETINDYLNSIELPKLTYDDLFNFVNKEPLKNGNENDDKLNVLITEFSNLIESLRKSPNFLDAEKIRKRFAESRKTLENLLEKSLNSDSHRSTLNDLVDEFNLLMRDLSSRLKGDYKIKKDKEFVLYYNRLKDILLSDNTDDSKRLQRYHATLDHLKDLLFLLEKENKKGSKEWHRLSLRITETDSRINRLNAEIKKKSETAESKNDKNIKKTSITKQKTEKEQKIHADFYDINNSLYHDNRILATKLAQIKIEYYKQLLEIEEEGSKEYYKIESQLAKSYKEYQIILFKQYDNELRSWLYVYSQRGAKERMEAELAVVDELYKLEKLKTEEVEEAKKAIRKKYRDEVNLKTGTKAKNQDFTDADDTYKKQLAALDDARKQGLISQEDYESRRWQIIQSYHGKIVELVKGEGDEWGSMVVNLVETWGAAFEKLGSSLPEKLKTIGDMAAAAFAVMNACLTSYTNYSNACRDIELAKVERTYSTEIKLAGNNDRKKKKLEEKKQKEIAKIKTKYNNKAMGIEIAQATAQSAIAAINAYASASKVSWVLGPIAASMALAAGALQIATIQKSHKAQAMGYYKGGFTSKDDNNHAVAGVVHANEFVANNKAVSNPELLPMFRLLDYAQKNNTIGSLTADDITSVMQSNNRSSALSFNSTDVETEMLTTYLANNTAVLNNAINVIDSLKEILSNGIETYMVMDGERGFEKKWERFQKLKNNPRR